MATNDWTQNTSVADLRAMGPEFNFFQALRLLESTDPKDGAYSALRLKGENSAAFKANFIEAVEISTNGEQPELKMLVNGFNLSGQNGPLPDIFSELFYREETSGNRGPNEFINIFNDRLLHSLFKMKKRFGLMLFNGSDSDGEHKKILESVSGLPTNQSLVEKLPRRYGEFWKTFSVALANRRINYSLLKNILTETLGIQISIEPGLGSWRELPREYRARIDGGARLGMGPGLGSRYWANSSRIGLRLFLDSRKRCLDLLPGGEEHTDFCQLVSVLVDGLHEVKVGLVLLWDSVPESRIEIDFRLGHTSWLKNTNSSVKTDSFPEFLISPSLDSNEMSEVA